MANQRAGQLRKEATEAERHLWSRLRRRQLDGHRFRRQVPIGAYIVDFACHDPKLVIEVDGGQHAENFTDDAVRTQWLRSVGFHVLRFWNNEVLQNTDGVVARIRETLVQRSKLQN